MGRIAINPTDAEILRTHLRWAYRWAIFWHVFAIDVFAAGYYITSGLEGANEALIMLAIMLGTLLLLNSLWQGIEAGWARLQTVVLKEARATL